jgi:hypothetical protein
LDFGYRFGEDSQESFFCGEKRKALWNVAGVPYFWIYRVTILVVGVPSDIRARSKKVEELLETRGVALTIVNMKHINQDEQENLILALCTFIMVMIWVTILS